jgi:outer membrane protein TolC
MKKSIVGRFSILGGLVCLSWLVFVLGDARAADVSAEVEALMKERVAVLEVLVKVAKAHYDDGTATYGEVLAASNELLSARLALASDVKTRVALREEMVVNLKELEKILQVQAEGGLVGAEEVLRAKAARLEAEALLLREAEE